DEEVDYWIHPPRQPTNILCWQIKTIFELRLIHDTHIAHFVFARKLESLFTHPRMWYFLAYFDEAVRTFRDPVFVVPATFLHSLGVPIARDRVRMEVYASMESDSNDKWTPYRASVHGIAKRIEEIFANLPPETPEQRLA